MAKKKRTVKLTPELALCSEIMVGIFDRIYKDSDHAEYHCTDDYYIKVSPRLAEHLYDHSSLELENEDNDDREGWIKKCTGQIIYFSHNNLPVSEEELLAEETIGGGSEWDFWAWNETTPSYLYWWADETTQDSIMFDDYHWCLFLKSLGLIQRMVKDGQLTLEEVWDQMNEIKEKKEDGIFFEGWISTPMPEGLSLENFVHYLFVDIFNLLYSYLKYVYYLEGMEDAYFKVLNRKLIDKYLETKVEYDYIGEDVLHFNDNLGKYVYAAWGGESFTDAEMDEYEWNGLYILTEEYLQAMYKELPLYVKPKKSNFVCSNFQGSEFVSRILIAHKLAFLNGKSDEQFRNEYKQLYEE